MSWLTTYEEALRKEYSGTRFESQVPSLVEFEGRGIESAEFVGDSWCECGEHDADQDSYYRKPVRGSHGWFHDPRKGGCGGITQTG